MTGNRPREERVQTSLTLSCPVVQDLDEAVAFHQPELVDQQPHQHVAIIFGRHSELRVESVQRSPSVPETVRRQKFGIPTGGSRILRICRPREVDSPQGCPGDPACAVQADTKSLHLFPLE